MTSFGQLNYLTLGAYLAATFLLGVWFSRKNKTTTDYFHAGGRIPWWVVGISLSNVSSISYMSIPAKAYGEDWSVFFVNLPILLLVPVVVLLFLPVFRSIPSASAYEYLETRFNLPVRLYGAAAFILFQIGRMALVIYLPALALTAVTDMNIFVCILLIGVLSAIYSALGGMNAVVWTDFAQTLFLLGAAFLSFGMIVWRLDGGLGQLASTAVADDKLRMLAWDGDHTTSVFWVVILGGLFSQLVPYVSDQSMIQRYMTTTDLRASGRAIWTNGALAMVNTGIFLAVGTAIYVYYKVNQPASAGLPGADAVLPFFIARELPAGIGGVVVAGIFAAAQSTISTSLNASSAVLVTDFLQRLGRKRDDAAWLGLAKGLTALFGVLAVTIACLLGAQGVGSAFDMFQRILGLTTSGLCGLFVLGMFTRRANAIGAIIGVTGSLVVLLLIQSQTRVHVYLYPFIGITTCIGLGYVASLPFERGRLAETVLTVYGLRKSPLAAAVPARVGDS